VLSLRELDRSLPARRLLLDRATVPVTAAGPLAFAPLRPLLHVAFPAEAGRVLAFEADDAAAHEVRISPAGSSTTGPAPRRAGRA
jgi:hypothetical protein